MTGPPPSPAVRTRIKICGIDGPATALAAVRAGADAVGVVLAEGSPRAQSARMALAIRRAVPTLVTVAIVLRDVDLDDAGTERDLAALAAAGCRLQLHGDEDEAVVARAAALAGGAVWRGFPFSSDALRRWDAHGDVDVLVVDGPRAGSGEPFDHRALADVVTDLHTPVLLAGGLDPANVDRAIRTVHPFGVDVSSGVESSPGVKDTDRIRAFAAAVHAADATLRTAD